RGRERPPGRVRRGALAWALVSGNHSRHLQRIQRFQGPCGDGHASAVAYLGLAWVDPDQRPTRRTRQLGVPTNCGHRLTRPDFDDHEIAYVPAPRRQLVKLGLRAAGKPREVPE